MARRNDQDSDYKASMSSEHHPGAYDTRSLTRSSTPPVQSVAFTNQANQQQEDEAAHATMSSDIEDPLLLTFTTSPTQLPSTEATVDSDETLPHISPEVRQFSRLENEVLESCASSGLPPDAHVLAPVQLPMAPSSGPRADTSHSPRTASASDEDGSNSTSPTTSTLVARDSHICKIVTRGLDPRLVNRHELIRDAPNPEHDDFSTIAQIIRTARSKTGVKHDFTWSEHYQILYDAIVTARIFELNTKLVAGLQEQALVRDVDPRIVAEQFRPMIAFTKTGNQPEIRWMWCAEHIELLGKLDLDMPEMGPEELDVLVKRTGAWTIVNWSSLENVEDESRH